MIEPVLLTLVGAAMIGAAAYDVTTLTIPNWISLILVGLFPVLALSAGLSWSEIGIHAGIGFGALVLGMVLFATRVVGGGDAKLFAALSLYMGTSIGTFVFAVAVAGGGLACAVLAMRSIALTGVTARFAWIQHLTRAGAGIPYGVAIAGGGLFVFPATHLFMLASVAH